MTLDQHHHIKAMRQYLTELELLFGDDDAVMQISIIIGAMQMRIEALGVLVEGAPPLESANQNAAYY